MQSSEDLRPSDERQRQWSRRSSPHYRGGRWRQKGDVCDYKCSHLLTASNVFRRGPSPDLHSCFTCRKSIFIVAHSVSLKFAVGLSCLWIIMLVCPASNGEQAIARVACRDCRAMVRPTLQWAIELWHAGTSHYDMKSREPGWLIGNKCPSVCLCIYLSLHPVTEEISSNYARAEHAPHGRILFLCFLA